MNALQRLELLGEHAELVQAIPTLKGMAKLDSLERLSQIVELLGGKVQDEVQNGNDVNGGTLSQVNSDKPQEIDVSNHRGKTDVETLFKVATSRGDRNDSFTEFGNISNEVVEKIKQITGKDVSGWTLGLDETYLRHILKNHGNADTESKRGQQEITIDDIKNIPNIVNQADKIYQGDVGDSIVFEKEMNGLYSLITTLRMRRRKLAVTTLYQRKPTSVLIAPAVKQSIDETPETLGSQAKGSVPQTPETLSAQNRTPGAIPLDENIPNTQTNVNSGALSQAFYDEFMLKNEMDELVFADDEVVDDVDIEMHEKALVDGKTYAFGRALIAIDEVVLSRPMWSVVFGDFHHTLMAVSLFDSIANVDDFSVVAQVGVNLNNPKYKQYVLRLAVSDDGNIIAYPNETGDTALRHTIHYSEKDNVRALINTAIQSIENERKQKDLLAQKQAKEAQLNAVNLSKKEIEQAFTGLSGVEIGRAKNQLLKTLTTREFGEQTYKAFIETLIDNKGYKPDVANMMKRKGENAGDTKTVYRIANDDGRVYEINKTQYAYAKWYYEQKQAENEPAPQDDEAKEPEHSPSNEDSAGALSQNEQENTMSEQENAPNEVEKGDFYEIYQLTQDDIDSERFGKLPSFVGTGEYFTKFYHLKAQGVNSSDFITMTHSRLKGVQDWVVREQQAIQENPFKDKEWENKDGKGKGRIIVLKGGVTKDMVMFGAVYNNEQVTKIGNFAKVNQFIENDDLAQAQRLAQEKAEKEAKQAEIKRQQEEQERLAEQQEEILVGKAELIDNEVMPAFEDTVLYDKRGNKFEAVMRLAEQSQNAKQLGFENNKGFIEYLAKQGYEFVKENEYSDDYVPMEYRSKFEHRGGNYGSVSSHYYAKLNDKSYEITEAEYHYGWYIRGKLNRGEMAMNASKNPNYSQSDIDYLQSIINGTLDLDTVDMDKMIEIGEKDEHDPMYEQALQVISEYLDKLTSV